MGEPFIATAINELRERFSDDHKHYIKILELVPSKLAESNVAHQDFNFYEDDISLDELEVNITIFY